jgi:polar amino acid transport system permease protein
MPADASLWDLIGFGPLGWGGQFAQGLLLTLAIAVSAYALGFGFGLLGAWAKLARRRWIRLLGETYTVVVRAFPELLLLLILYFSGTAALAALLGLVGFGRVEVSSFGCAVMALGFILGAYMTEVLRGAFQAIPKGQAEAARALGLRPAQMFRRVLLPQMLRYALPGLSNLWLNITKDAALVSVLGGMPELLATGNNAAGYTKHYLFFFSVTAALFLAITLASTLALWLLERRLSRGLGRG